jgi:hypothetical protein
MSWLLMIIYHTVGSGSSLAVVSVPSTYQSSGVTIVYQWFHDARNIRMIDMWASHPLQPTSLPSLPSPPIRKRLLSVIRII